MSILPADDRREAAGGGTAADGPPPSLRRRILLTAFILFHFTCVATWVLPRPNPVRTFLLSRKIPLPTRHTDPVTKATGWRIEPLFIIGSYLGRTGQWQHWNLFAPDPLSYFRHVEGRVVFRSGTWKEFSLARVEQLDYFSAHLDSRIREYQYALASAAALEDLGRFLARSVKDPSDPPVHVTIYFCTTEIPRHDRPGRSPSTDYTALLHDPARVVKTPVLEYDVKPEELR